LSFSILVYLLKHVVDINAQTKEQLGDVLIPEADRMTWKKSPEYASNERDYNRTVVKAKC
jgi:hypothetical protein